MAILLLSFSARSGELERGLQAYEQADYARAHEILYPLADQHGYVKAMNVLGIMAEKGQGVERNGVEAEKWYHKAALLADEDAMYNLGILYAEGEAVDEDYVRAIAWLGAAYDHQQKMALQVAKLISTKMTEEQLAAAGVLRKEISVQIYESAPAELKNTLSDPPVDRPRLMSAEEIIDTYSGHTVSYTFRDSVASETYRKHSSKKKALAGKKAKLTGEYRDGFFSGKWWVEDDMMCFDYAKIEVFDACIWIEKISDGEMRTYNRKTGETGLDKITN